MLDKMGKKIIIAAILIFILVSVPLTIFLVNQRQETRMKAAPSTNLFFEPQSQTLNIGDSLEINISIDTQENQVISSDLNLEFDPSLLEPISITPGSFLQNPIEVRKALDPTLGRIDFSFYTMTPQQGSGILATVRFITKTGGVAQVKLGEKTGVGASQGNGNITLSKVDGVYTINSNTVLQQTAGTAPSDVSIAPTTNSQTGSATSNLDSSNLGTQNDDDQLNGGTGGTSETLALNTISPTPTITPSPTPTLLATPTIRVTPTPTSSYVTPTITTEPLPTAGILENTILLALFGIVIVGLGIFFLI